MNDNAKQWIVDAAYHCEVNLTLELQAFDRGDLETAAEAADSAQWWSEVAFSMVSP